MDDYTAVPPLAFDIINAIVVWMIYVEKGERLLHLTAGHDMRAPLISGKDSSKVALYWLTSISWYTIIWYAWH